LPVGVSGRVVALLSGGFDSPVAAARMMRRGCHVIFVHFHSHPYLDTSSQEKVRALAARLVRRQLKAKLFLVPFGDLQREIVSRCAPAARVVVYRRFMVRIADLIAEREEASALVTGESVGQVASQTLANLSLIGQVGKRLVLRPLIGMDKDEIIREAKALGTYDISIQRDQDCCALFLPRSPATRAAPGIIARAEAGMEIERVVREAADAAQEIEIRFPG
jgi:thiamine biosynthesis protein ThiI